MRDDTRNDSTPAKLYAGLIGATLSGLLSVREAKRRGLKVTGRTEVLSLLVSPR